MSDKLFALLTVSISGAFAVVVALLSHWFTVGRERRAFQRTSRKEQVEALRGLYEEALAVIWQHGEAVRLQRARDAAAFWQFVARLEFRATPEVLKAWDEAGAALLRWQQLGPGARLPLTPSDEPPSVVELNNQEALRRGEEFDRAFHRIQGAMKEHVRRLQAELEAG